MLFFLQPGASNFASQIFSYRRPKNKERNRSFFFVLVRVERIELSSQVWKTCILTAVLHSLMGWVIGIEPTTFWTTIRRSNQLSYTHQIFKNALYAS